MVGLLGLQFWFCSRGLCSALEEERAALCPGHLHGLARVTAALGASALNLRRLNIDRALVIPALRARRGGAGGGGPRVRWHAARLEQPKVMPAGQVCSQACATGARGRLFCFKENMHQKMEKLIVILEVCNLPKSVGISITRLGSLILHSFTSLHHHTSQKP